MTKKKRAHPDVEEILQRPWCYYCERDFDDLKILISHQKAKHFKCERCGRRLNTAGGLSVHLQQVHKETLTQVENALPNRLEVGVEIFGMEGIPEDVMSAHQQRVTAAFFRHESERRAATGNPPPGGKSQGEGGPAKKPKIETSEEIKKRLAEHKARKEAEKLGLVSNPATPVDVDGYGAPATTAPIATTSPDAIAPFQPPYGAGNSGSPPQAFNPYQPPPQPAFPGFSGSQPYQMPGAFAHPAQGMPMQGYPGPPRPYMPQQAFIPASPMGYGQPTWNGAQPQFSAAPPQFSAAAPVGYGHPSPPPPPPSHGPYYNHPWTSPPTGPPMSAPGMTPGLPQPGPGLPQRPAFQAPNLSKEEMALMHAGQVQSIMPGQLVHHANGGWNFSSQPPKPALPEDRSFGWISGSQSPQPEIKQEEMMSLGDSVDDLINSVTGQGSYARPSSPYAMQSSLHGRPTSPYAKPSLTHAKPSSAYAPGTSSSFAPGTSAWILQNTPDRRARPIKQESPETFPVQRAAIAANKTAATADKKDKKKKKHRGDETKLIYSDNRTSPEEKMAQHARYAFQRVEHTETVLGDLSGAVTGATDETVRDPQD
ncbi:hypothetical protein LTR36_006080 [Oleoguttula mirabilis]|uniref:Zinc finger protein 207 n=1 Tax=Oleoguttula mirabilis TaxID=1507867 RepID=A0AAV9JCV1_9PEZI|nr:hypothetical protein LTR36_006080 [Oleoguttula mirabilis]